MMSPETKIHVALDCNPCSLDTVALVLGMSRRKLAEWSSIGRAQADGVEYDGKLRVRAATEDDADRVVTIVRRLLNGSLAKLNAIEQGVVR